MDNNITIIIVLNGLHHFDIHLLNNVIVVNGFEQGITVN